MQQVAAQPPITTYPTLSDALFPKEVTRPPRVAVARKYALTRWTEMPRGGHFAAMEEPELFVDSVRAFFRTVR